MKTKCGSGAALLAELKRIIHEERHEAEPEYVEAVKA
jgi:hypothetical protein